MIALLLSGSKALLMSGLKVKASPPVDMDFVE
jgi:hypothetical protein